MGKGHSKRKRAKLVEAAKVYGNTHAVLHPPHCCCSHLLPLCYACRMGTCTRPRFVSYSLNGPAALDAP